MDNYLQRYDKYKEEIEGNIEEIMESCKGEVPQLLHDSMVYSACGGGKRVRGVLLMAAGEMLGVKKDKLGKFAAAVEMVHASSLIHDDLPCMDNDTLRRGKPCNHIVFGEANALYAGLGLLNLSYEVLLKNLENEREVRAIYELARSAGPTGIMKGQSLDILNEGKEVDFETLKVIHSCKTGALIRTSVVVPALLAGADKNVLSVMEEYGRNMGTAFQIVDDVLDVTGSSEELGKTAGKDIKSDKLTYVKLFGVDKAMAMAEEHINSAIAILDSIECDSGFLKETAKLILNRRN